MMEQWSDGVAYSAGVARLRRLDWSAAKRIQFLDITPVLHYSNTPNLNTKGKQFELYYRNFIGDVGFVG
jgi:hypothetical protein